MRHQPKRFAPPRSRRWRSMRDERRFGRVTMTMILKTLYPQARLSGGREFKRPWWADQAYARGWMTFEAYYAVPEEFTGRVFKSLLYEQFPMFGLVKKETNFAAGAP